MIIKRIIKKIILMYIKLKGVKCKNDLRIMGFPKLGTEPYLIEIGYKVTISNNVQFINHDGGTVVFRNNERYKDVIKFGKIQIGDNCFIGANSILMPGIKIGNNCVIGAGSIVTKDIPDNSVAVGTPAKVIMTIDEYAEKSLNNLIDYNIHNFKGNKRGELERIYMN